MKALVIFGSKSDANIYEPLKSRLIHNSHEVDFRMLSVHRSPELLDKELSSIQADVFIAGAGLAAHLPGTLASKSLKPVVGIPCTAALGGMDSLLAIMQMPFGIPVLTTAPNEYEAAVDLAGRVSRLDLQFSFEKFFLVVDRNKRNSPVIQMQMERAKKISEKTGIEIELKDKPQENAVNICLVEINEKDPKSPLGLPPIPESSDEVRIYVPILNETLYRSDSAADLVYQRISSTPLGLWVGVNNVGNALLANLQLANSAGVHNAFLTNAKKGYIHT
ncbi:MAG: AIR carboxylase family protein [Oligoflexia bacterium]|nr:AIR carboxylase family protein [Oligoflexia bacterium]